MSEQYTESDLKSLTVVKLKELLADRSLPVTGRKDDLITRLLSSTTTTSAGAEATTTLPLPTTDTTGHASSTDEPDGAGLSGTAEVSAASGAEDLRSAEEKDEGLKSATAPVPEVSEEQKKALLAFQAKDEEERRRKRAERFGLSAIQGEKGDEGEEVKRKRAERFGLQNAGEEEAGGEVDKKMGKSLEALSSALGTSRTRKPKADATSKSAPSAEKSVPQLAGSKKGKDEVKKKQKTDEGAVVA
ncbi:hypothetical protein AAT19DRAFT_11913 [Rhodotorula toruloides]|uniref:SAP domain-containing protein n=1 Tax=Rhodotorula toruloides TaxID=5286 RepID=A0A2T0AER3_RHOTO|nr:hypothetical protein AAT19DRAFT_11913 [Rhodotorula toruloides]